MHITRLLIRTSFLNSGFIFSILQGPIRVSGMTRIVHQKKLFRHDASCKSFANFVRKTLLNRLTTGANSLLGKWVMFKPLILFYLLRLGFKVRVREVWGEFFKDWDNFLWK